LTVTDPGALVYDSDLIRQKLGTMLQEVMD